MMKSWTWLITIVPIARALKKHWPEKGVSWSHKDITWLEDFLTDGIGFTKLRLKGKMKNIFECLVKLIILDTLKSWLEIVFCAFWGSTGSKRCQSSTHWGPTPTLRSPAMTIRPRQPLCHFTVELEWRIKILTHKVTLENLYQICTKYVCIFKINWFCWDGRRKKKGKNEATLGFLLP